MQRMIKINLYVQRLIWFFLIGVAYYFSLWMFFELVFITKLFVYINENIHAELHIMYLMGK